MYTLIFSLTKNCKEHNLALSSIFTEWIWYIDLLELNEIHVNGTIAGSVDNQLFVFSECRNSEILKDIAGMYKQNIFFNKMNRFI